MTEAELDAELDAVLDAAARCGLDAYGWIGRRDADGVPHGASYWCVADEYRRQARGGQATARRLVGQDDPLLAVLLERCERLRQASDVVMAARGVAVLADWLAP